MTATMTELDILRAEDIERANRARAFAERAALIDELTRRHYGVTAAGVTVTE